MIVCGVVRQGMSSLTVGELLGPDQGYVMKPLEAKGGLGQCAWRLGFIMSGLGGLLDWRIGWVDL